jgi:hypothetical protein
MEPGKNASEIVVTPEMIEAGLSVISGFELLDAWEGNLPRAELVKAILSAALAKTLQS